MIMENFIMSAQVERNGREKYFLKLIENFPQSAFKAKYCVQVEQKNTIKILEAKFFHLYYKYATYILRNHCESIMNFP